MSDTALPPVPLIRQPAKPSANAISASPAIANEKPAAGAWEASRAKSEQPSIPAEHLPFDDYLQRSFEGLYHILTRVSALSLLCFELAFWTVGTAFCLLLLLHAPDASDPVRLFTRGLVCVGIGLLAGALGIARIRNHISPIFTYAPAFALTACGFHCVFNAAPEPAWRFVAMLGLGLGGGLIVGRMNADLAAVTDSALRAGVFSFKKMALAATIIATLLALPEPDFTAAQLQALTFWLPRLLLFSLPIVLVLSWIIDIDIHTKNELAEIREFPGPLQRFGYRALRGLARMIFKPLFHFQPVDARNVPETGGVVLAANHGSFLDPIFLSCGTDRLVQYVIYSKYYRSWAHPLFRFLRCIPVDEKEQTGALRVGVRALKLGACIGIFPEGEVSADGKLHSPQRGALYLAQRAGAPVVSVALKGNVKALPRGAWLPHAVKVTPIFGKPFAVDKDLPKKETAELTDKLMSDLAQKLEVESPPKIADSVENEEKDAQSVRG